LELRQLKYFIAIAEELHFGRAAEKLNVTPSALSQQIQLLESELRVDLFDQNKRMNFRRVELTEAGHVFLEEARKTLKQSEIAIEKARNAHKKEVVIRFGVFKTILPERVEKMMELFTTHLPNIKINIVEFPSSNLTQAAIHDDLVDIGLSVLPLKFNTLDVVRYNETQFGILVNKDHHLASADNVSFKKLANEKWVDYGKEVNPFYEQIELACNNQGFSRENKVAQVVPSIELLKRWISGNKGIAFVPISLDISREPNLTIKPIVNNDGTPFADIRIHSVLAYKKDSPTALVQSLINVVRKTVTAT
jgi:DNA-binding transcriptional LysR family regulator